MDYSHFQFHANMASGAAFDASQTVSHTVPQSMTRYTMGGVDMQQMQTDNTHMAPNALVHDGYNYHGHITNTSYASSGAVDPMHMNTPSAHTQLGMVVGQTLPDSMVAVACLPMDSINTQRPLEMGNMHMSSQPIGVRFSSGNVHMQEEHNQNLLMAMEPSNCQGSDVGDQNMGRMGWMSQSDPIDNHMFSSHSDFANSQQREGDFTRETLANNNVCAGAALSQTQGLLNNDSCLVNIPHGGFLPISLQKNEPGAISIPSMPSADMAHTTQGPAQLPAQMQQQLQQQAISANMQHQPTDSYGGSFQQPQIQMQQQSQMSRQSDNVMSTYNHNADGRLSQGNMPMLNASGAWSVADTTMNAIQTMQGQALHGVWLLPGQQQSSVNTMSNGTNNSVNLLSSDAMSVGHTGGVPTSSTSISGWNVIGAAARDFNSSNASMYNAYIVPSPHAINIMQNPPALRNPAIQSNLDAAQQGQVEEKRKREGSLLAADAAANEADALQLVAGIRELCETLEQASDNVKHQIALRKDELAGIQGGGGRGKGAKGRGVKQGSKEKPEKSSKVGKGRGKKDAHPNIPNGPSGWPARGPIDVKTQAVIDRMNDPYTLQNNNLAGAFVSQPNAVGKTEMRGVGWGYEMPNDAVSKSSSDINDLIMAHEGGVSGLPHSSSQVPCFGATKQQLAATKTMQGATRPRKDGVLSKVQQAKSVGQGPAAVIMKTRKQILDNHAVAPAKAGKKRGGESTAAGDTSAPAMRSVNAILEQLGGFATTATPTVVGAHTSGAPGYHGASQTCSMVRPHPPVDNGAALLKSSALMVGGEAANAEHTKASNENSHTGRRENWNRPAQRHDKTFTNTLETATNTLETASNTLETAANTLGHDKTGTNTLGVAGQRRGKMSSTSLSTSNVRPGAFECALRPQRWCAVSAGDTLASGEKNEKSDSVDDVKDVPLNPTGKKDSKGLPASGKTLEVLIQASMMTILYDASRNVSIPPQTPRPLSAPAVASVVIYYSEYEHVYVLTGSLR